MGSFVVASSTSKGEVWPYMSQTMLEFLLGHCFIPIHQLEECESCRPGLSCVEPLEDFVALVNPFAFSSSSSLFLMVVKIFFVFVLDGLILLGVVDGGKVDHGAYGGKEISEFLVFELSVIVDFDLRGDPKMANYILLEDVL